MSRLWILAVLVLSACGGGSSQATATEPRPVQTENAEARPAPPAHASCRVIVEEGGAESRRSEYEFASGVLSRVVVTDAVSGRSFTTRYTWDDAGVTVEKLEGEESTRPPMVMRYTGSRQSGEIVGEHAEDGVLVERVTWSFDDEARPVRRDHEWFPSPEGSAAAARRESDACSYDGEGRAATFELTLESEPVLLIFYRYEGDARFPAGIVEKHIVGPEVPPRDNTIADVEASSMLRVTWPGEATNRSTRYEGDCASVFYPAVCSSGMAPR